MQRRLRFQSLETRRLLAAELMGATSVPDSGPEFEFGRAAAVLQIKDLTLGLEDTSEVLAEGELLHPRHLEGDGWDRVAFAEALTSAGITLYGARGSDSLVQQLQPFQDGAEAIRFVDWANFSNTGNPVWRDATGELEIGGPSSLQELSLFFGVPIPLGHAPSFRAVGDQTLSTQSPRHIPIDAYDPQGGILSVDVDVQDSGLLTANVLQGNRSLRIDVAGYGAMVFQLFEGRSPISTDRIIELVEQQFYDGLIFHQVFDHFVIKTGDPTGTGVSGSLLPDLDDEFHPDLQYNQSGVLGLSNAGDDSGNSQIFVTEGPQHFLDFEFTVLGQLVEGESVREAISNRQTDRASRPISPIVIDSVEVFNDDENSVVILRPTGAFTGSSEVTITVADSQGNSSSETVLVTVLPDTINSAPFFDPIVMPQGPRDQPLSLTLGSTDLEGDPVIYDAALNDPALDASLSVDDEGRVTVIPPTGFVGDIFVDVFVRQVSDVPTTYSNRFDSQRVVFHFRQADATLTLEASSDTGASDQDGITSATELAFLVNDTLPGDRIELRISGQTIAEAVSDGVVARVMTDQIAARGEGQYEVSAVVYRDGKLQFLGFTSVTYDATAPELQTYLFPRAVRAGTAVTLPLATNDRTSTSFKLTDNPENVALLGDQLLWLPDASQIGIQVFELGLIDAAGNTGTANFSITVSEAPVQPLLPPLMQVIAIPIDASGQRISKVEVGQEFSVILRATDLRDGFNSDGVYSAYADVFFDSELVRPEGESPLRWLDGFTTLRSGTLTPWGIDEWGAVSSDFANTGREVNNIAGVKMRAIAPGELTIRTDPSDNGYEMLLFGLDDLVAPDRVQFASVSLTVESAWHREADPADVNGDGRVTPSDALVVINVLAAAGGRVATGDLGSGLRSSGLQLDVVEDGFISTLDVLNILNVLLISAQRRLAANAIGDDGGQVLSAAGEISVFGDESFGERDSRDRALEETLLQLEARSDLSRSLF